MATAAEVMVTAERFAKRRRLDDDRLSRLVSDAWFVWHNAHDQTLPPSAYVLMAYRRLGSGRDLPGCGGSQRDVWQRRSRYQGAGMTGAVEHRPGPERLAEEGEWFAWFYAGLTEQQRRMVDLHRAGVERTEDLAREMGVSPGRVSQIRREILAAAMAAR